MTIHTGIDLAEVWRIEKSMHHPAFLERCFSAEERALFLGKGMNPRTVAANFAAKEAFAKALGTGIRGFALNEVALLRDQLGRPYFAFTGRALEIAERSGRTFSVSVTHTREYASAVVVSYEDGADGGSSED